MTRRRENGTGSVWYEEARHRWVGRIKIGDKTTKISGLTKRAVTDKLRVLKDAPLPTGYTVSRAADQYLQLAVKPPTLRPATYTQYEFFLRKYIVPAIGSMRVEDVRPQHIQGIISGMAELTHHGKAGPVPTSSTTMFHCQKVAHCLFEWLKTNEVLKENPVRKVTIPKTLRRKRRSLTPDEIARLMDALKDKRMKHAVRFLLMTGLRRGEMVALRHNDIEGDVIHVRRTRSNDGIEGPPKSESGQRDILIGKTVRGILYDQAEMLRLERVISPHVFPARTGAAMSPNDFSSRVSKYATAAGLKMTVHELRHTFVSLIADGMDIKTLQTILGHSKPEITLGLYKHMLEGSLERAADRIDAAALQLEESARNRTTTPRIAPKDADGYM